MTAPLIRINSINSRVLARKKEETGEEREARRTKDTGKSSMLCPSVFWGVQRCIGLLLHRPLQQPPTISSYFFISGGWFNAASATPRAPSSSISTSLSLLGSGLFTIVRRSPRRHPIAPGRYTFRGPVPSFLGGREEMSFPVVEHFKFCRVHEHVSEPHRP